MSYCKKHDCAKDEDWVCGPCSEEAEDERDLLLAIREAARGLRRTDKTNGYSLVDALWNALAAYDEAMK